MNLLVTADWHLRGDRPRCRTEDDWIEIQRCALREIVEIVSAKKIPLLVIGDIFNRSNPSAEIITMMIEILNPIKEYIYFIPGNHDLPYHQWKNENKSAYGILKRIFNEITDLEEIGAAPFGEPLNNPDAEIICVHELIFPDDKSRPIKGIGKTAEELAKEYPKAKWILTGDYHHHFLYYSNNQHVINPGCIIRQAADLKDYKPSIYEINTNTDDITPISLIDSKYLLNDNYLQEEENRNERIDSFVSTIEKNGKVSLNFIENLEQKMNAPSVDSETKKILTEIIEEI